MMVWIPVIRPLISNRRGGLFEPGGAQALIQSQPARRVACGGQMAVASARRPLHIERVNKVWEQLCLAAAAEIEDTLDALPEPLRARAAELPVTFEPRPHAGFQAAGIAPDTLGLFTGGEFAVQDSVPLPPQIILFLENIWEFSAGDEAVFSDEVHTTFLHELGHYLGLDEDDLAERGLD